MPKVFRITVLLFIFFLASWVYSCHDSVYHKRQGEELVFTVKNGEGVSQVAIKLFQDGVIDSQFCFKYYIWKNDLSTKIQAGKYILHKGSSAKNVVSVLVSGEVISRERDIKIIEGLRDDEIGEYLENQSVGSKDDFLKITATPLKSWGFPFSLPDFLTLADQDKGLNGFLFGDTYRIYDDAGIDDVLYKMLSNLNNKLSKSDIVAIKNDDYNLNEIIILASIIEKEVRGDNDRRVVSGILRKRLSIGMRLEVDSTINYITKKKNPQSTYNDLQIESPYNTYKNYGLPPGPICNPSLGSILAAIYPEESPYLFYLNRLDTGETIFGRDFNEHIRNKNKYLK